MRRIIVAFLFSLVVCFGVAPRAEAAGASAHVVQHNVHGTATSALLNRVASHHPLGVTIQEVCAPQYLNAAATLGNLDYSSHPYRTILGSSGLGVCAGGVSVYNVVATLGNVVGVFQDAFMEQHALDIGGSVVSHWNVRGYACIQAGFGFNAWVVCSSHFSSRGEPQAGRIVAEVQAQEMHNWLTFWFSSIVRIFGVDFNRRPCQGVGTFGPYDYYQYYFEADQTYGGPWSSCGDNRPTLGAKKIDYVWISKDGMAAGDASAYRNCSTGSDHCLLHADDLTWK